MAKSRKTDKKRLEENRGTGHGKTYIPWLKVVEVPSKGRSHRPFGIKTKRVHYFLSDIEEYYFYLMEWNDNVIDIREQYPLLPIEQTELLAKKLGFKHPNIPKINSHATMTTDFMLTVRDGNVIKSIARTIKTREEVVSSARVREKMKIEEEYWKLKGINWAIVTDDLIPVEKAKNLKLIRGTYFLVINNLFNKRMVPIVKNHLVNLTEDVNNWSLICHDIDKTHNIALGTSINIAKYLIWEKELQVDLSTVLDFTNIKTIKEVDSCG